jgi:L-histidine N-alpha-methyltransferase
MSVRAQAQLSQFALEVAEGLSGPSRKKLSPRFFYDDLGSSLFEAITLVPEYGLSRADERLLQIHSRHIGLKTGPLCSVVELGSGTGKKTKHVLSALAPKNSRIQYRPIDLSAAALDACSRELGDLCDVKPVCADWMNGLAQVAMSRKDGDPLLLLFLGSSIGNLERESVVDFLDDVRSHLQPGDFFLLGVDLVKDEQRMVAAYDDPTGVTAAFNLNLLGRINRELDANFDLRAFIHEVRWNESERRIEMHLLSQCEQSVHIGALEMSIDFQAGETIWTESSHKFTEEEIEGYALASRFRPVATWVDPEWPFAEVLWQVPTSVPPARPKRLF